MNSVHGHSHQSHSTDSDYTFRRYGADVSAALRGDRLYHAERYYGSSTRSIHARDIIREDGSVVHTVITLLDKAGSALATLDTSAMDDALGAIVRRDRRPGASVAPTERAPPPLPPLLRARCTHGAWTIELRELHRWRTEAGIMNPYEIAKIEYRTEL